MSSQIEFQEAASVFGVLHNVWFQKPSESMLCELKGGMLDHWPAQSDQELSLCHQIQTSLELESVEFIQRDHFRLFIGAHKKLAYPWGSVYTDVEGLIFGETNQEFEQFCRQHQVELALPFRQPHDHIGIISGVLSKLFAAAAESTPQSDQTAIKTLLSEHLMPWVERFLISVDMNANTAFYRGFSGLMRAQLTHWCELLDVKPRSIKIYR